MKLIAGMLFLCATNEDGATGMLFVVTCQQTKGRIQKRTNYWAKVLSNTNIIWGYSYDFLGENNLTIITNTN